jgi:hypothetical protein
MPDQFAQSTGPISIDLNGIWQALIDHLGAIGTAIWAGISSNLPMIGTTIWNALANALFGAIRTLLLAIWGAALFDIPHAMTDQFPPVAALLAAGPLIAGAGLVLALSLLAFRTWLRGLAGHGGILDELLGRILVYLSMLSILPWVIARAIDLESAFAKTAARVDLGALIPGQVGPTDAISFTIAGLIMIVLGIRLWFKLASNIVHVAVAVAWSPLAMICGLMPETRWVTALWTREFVGRLAGAVLALVATIIGIGFAVLNAGVLQLVAVGAAFMAAHDLVDWLARTPGGGMGGVVGMGMRMGVGLMTGGGGGAVSAGAQAAQMRSLAASDRARAEQAFYSFD